MIKLNSTSTILVALFTCVATASGNVNIQPNEDGDMYTGVFVNGSPSSKYDIVIIGDGFTASEQDKFNQKVEGVINALWLLEPYASHMCAFNIWRVNVVSNESGIDQPGQYPQVWRDTELNCTYGNPLDPYNPTPLRLITSQTPLRCFEAANYAPAVEAVVVLANNEEWGGAKDGNGLVFSAIPSNFNQIVTHELGHKIGMLADEYFYLLDSSDPPLTYTGPEPTQPNVTTKTVLSEIKWKDWILPGTPLPTTLANANSNTLGLWEGGMYHTYGIYRPMETCQMRDSEQPFCGVCYHRIADFLEYFETEPPNLICSGLLRQLRNMGRMPLQEIQSRFLIPWCLTCPPNVAHMDEVILVMDGLPAEFQLQIVDEMGNLIADGRTTKTGKIASFDADPTRQYYVDVTSNGAPSAGMLNFQADLSINGEQVAMP